MSETEGLPSAFCLSVSAPVVCVAACLQASRLCVSHTGSVDSSLDHTVKENLLSS